MRRIRAGLTAEAEENTMKRKQIAKLPAITSGNGAALKKLAEYEKKARGAVAPNTVLALRADTAIFVAWCAEYSHETLPASPDTVTAFIDAQSEVKAPATIKRYIASIAHLHRAAGLDDPTKDDGPKLALKRMARAKGTRQKQASPLNRPAIDRMITSAGDSLRGLRDIALVTTLYDTLARSTELIDLDVEDMTTAEDGAGTVIIKRSKGDQEGQGSIRFLAADTVEHVKRWIEEAGIEDGPLFRAVAKGGDVRGRLYRQDIRHILIAMAKRAGLDIDPSGHSVRIGVAQDMVSAGFSLPEIMVAGGWRSPEMVARYSEHLQVRSGAAAKLAAKQNRT